MLSLLDLVALAVWPKARSRRLAAFVRACRRGGWDPGDTERADQCPPEATLVAALDFAGSTSADALALTLREQADRALERAAATGLVPVTLGDARYPALLAHIIDPPLVLWVRGLPGVLQRPAVALVGSRAASPYGLETATRLASSLAAHGLASVSGLARGVDSAAHRGALEAGGSTIAVLGSGADAGSVYPREHESLARAIAESGAVVSELPPGTPPRALHFPARNRIISGLSLAVVVVEAAEQSGSLITAEFAADQGRTVMAVPGSILAGRHGGCHQLIKDGAALVHSAEDVIYEVETSPLRGLNGGVEAMGARTVGQVLLDSMAPGEAYDIDGLGRETGLSPSVLLSSLLELELQRAVRRVEGSRFVRVSRTC
jgi:DNA processing protein